VGRSADARTLDTRVSFAALCADDRAFSDWYEAALPRVYGFVYGRVGDVGVAEDITAQAFLDAIRARSSFDGRSDPVTWICSIARNRLVDHYRRAERDRAGRLRLIVTEIDTESSAAWDRADQRDMVMAALAELPPLERGAVVLHYLDGYSVRDTARLLGRSEAATESLLSRARGRVRAAFPGGIE
jgi:RNA polymerase sigma-70 factor (ECF subfamily)